MSNQLKPKRRESLLYTQVEQRKNDSKSSLKRIFDLHLEELISSQKDYTLFLSPYNFVGRSQGGAIRTNNICQELSKTQKLVTIEFYFWDPDTFVDLYEVKQISKNWIHFRCLHKGAWVYSTIRHLNDHYLNWQTPEMYDLIEHISSIKSPSCLWLEFSWMAPYANWCPTQCKNIVLSLHNIEHQIVEETQSRSINNIKDFKPSFPGNLSHVRRSEESFIKMFDRIVTTTEKDAKYCKSINAQCETFVAPNIITTKIEELKLTNTSNSMPNKVLRLVFVGDCHYLPNKLGLEWFVTNIVDMCTPEINSKFKLDIFGKGSLELIDLSRENVKLNGFAEILEDVYKDNVISLIPLLHGGGSRLKAFEAIQQNKLILTTPKGIEGIDIPQEMKDFIFHFGNCYEWAHCLNKIQVLTKSETWQAKLDQHYHTFLANAIAQFKSAITQANGD